LYAFGYGYQTSLPFSRILERSDKNKDGVISPDEYGGVNVLRAAGRFIGDGDGFLTEAEWDLWNDHVRGLTGLVAVDLSHASSIAKPLLLWRFDKGFESVIPSPLLYQEVLYSVKNGGILTAFDAVRFRRCAGLGHCCCDLSRRSKDRSHLHDTGGSRPRSRPSSHRVIRLDADAKRRIPIRAATSKQR
jgi:hypothetical protein